MMNNEPVLPNNTIRNPTEAWPTTEAINQIPWFQVMAFCNVSFGTMAASMVPKLGPVNDRKMPVKKIMM